MARELVEGTDYTTSVWKGNDVAETKYRNLDCTHCQFSTLYMEKMVLHYLHQNKHKHHWANPVETPAPTQEAPKIVEL